MNTITITSKSYRLKKNTNLTILKNDSIDERMAISYICPNCENSSEILENIAHWENKK